MTHHTPFNFESFKRIWHISSSKEDIEEVSRLIEFNSLLHETLLVQGSALAVLNIDSMHYTCILGNAEKVGGFNVENYLKEGVKFFLSQIPIADYSALEKFLKKMNDYFIQLSDNEAKKFKAIFDFKVKREDGTFSRICQENICLKRASNGAILLLFALVTDITNQKKDGKQHFYLTNGTDEYLFYINNLHNEMQKTELLSKRELEIAKLIGQNLSSEEIARRLHISNHTVNTHRRNMLHKMEMEDTLELISFLKVFRFI